MAYVFGDFIDPGGNVLSRAGKLLCRENFASGGTLQPCHQNILVPQLGDGTQQEPLQSLALADLPAHGLIDGLRGRTSHAMQHIHQGALRKDRHVP